jgi:hypothetical protein
MIGRIYGACCDPTPASRRWICFPRVLDRALSRAYKEGANGWTPLKVTEVELFAQRDPSIFPASGDCRVWWPDPGAVGSNSGNTFFGPNGSSPDLVPHQVRSAEP